MERLAMDDRFLDADGASPAGFHDGIILPSVEPSNLDLQFLEFPISAEGFQFDDGVFFTSLEQTSDPYSFAPFYNASSVVDFSDDHGSYPMLNYINQILMEEEQLEEQPSWYHDPLALQAAEDSFYQILGKNYSPSPSEPAVTLDRNAQSPDGSTQSSSHHGTSSSSIDSSASGDSISILDGDKSSGKDYQPVDSLFMSPFQANAFVPLQPPKSSSIIGDGQISSFTNRDLISNFLSETETISLFKKGLEEGNKFLPTGSQLSIDLDKYKSPSKQENMEVVASGKNDKEEHSINRLRRRKHQLQDNDESDLGRSSKQSAVNGEEGELAKIFDALVLCADRRIQRSEADAGQSAESCKILGQNELPNCSDVVKGSEKRQGTDVDTIDLSTTLISCAQSVATGDQRAANEQLKLIRQHASCTGTPHQRLAVIFANALEARLTGTGPDRYAALTSKQNSAAEDLKSHRVFLCAPFRQMISFFANKMILKAASKATTLHIVDFGICHGFQWPNLIQQLSQRAGGAPKLRITGIDVPQPGFRPAERIEQTMRRLAKYCQKFNIPFQFQAIASKNWDRIKIEELKLARNEVLAVNTHFHLKNLLDETVDADCPRDAVLRLIRNMNPDIYVSATLNAPVAAPFFLTRFRDALLFYSTIFDVLDNNLPPEDQQRMKFEQGYFGPEVMNVIACEGKARVERPETYRQWQIRYNRAGFRLLPLNQDLLKELKGKVKEGYHKDFMLDGDGYWMHMGWKGKIIASCSCWLPA